METKSTTEPIYIFDNDIIHKAPSLLHHIKIPPVFKYTFLLSISFLFRLKRNLSSEDLKSILTNLWLVLQTLVRISTFILMLGMLWFLEEKNGFYFHLLFLLLLHYILTHGLNLFTPIYNILLLVCFFSFPISFVINNFFF